MKHKHYDAIVAWAAGADMQCRFGAKGEWSDRTVPAWADTYEYRIKPIPKPDVVRHISIEYSTYMGTGGPSHRVSDPLQRAGNNIKCIFDGETNQLKEVEIIK